MGELVVLVQIRRVVGLVLKETKVVNILLEISATGRMVLGELSDKVGR
jgi:hypothetical protein